MPLANIALMRSTAQSRGSWRSPVWSSGLGYHQPRSTRKTASRNLDVSISLAEPSPKHRVALIKAAYGQCRFIVSEPGARVVCCGASTQRGSSWCAWH